MSMLNNLQKTSIIFAINSATLTRPKSPRILSIAPSIVLKWLNIAMPQKVIARQPFIQNKIRLNFVNFDDVQTKLNKKIHFH
jgi:hypothetical protein